MRTFLPPPDQQQRDRAVNPAGSVHVEAPAGSGKTTVLLQRFLTILAQGARPEEILALTFTRKAAGELRTRVQGKLQGQKQSEEIAETNDFQEYMEELGQAALRRHVDREGIAFLERLQIKTFHSFCAHILGLVPHAAGLPPDTKVMDELEASQWQAEAVEILRQRMASLPVEHPDRQALVRRLVRLNNSWPRLAGELQNLLARRDILSQFIALARSSYDQEAYAQLLLEQLQARVLPDLDQLAQEFRQSQIGAQWPQLVRYLRDSEAQIARNLPADLPGAALADLPAWVGLAKSILTTKGACYRSFRSPQFPPVFNAHELCDLLRDIPDSLVRRLNTFRDLPAILIHADEAEAVRDLMVLLDRVLEIYEKLCLTRRAMDFTALEEKALLLLRQGAVSELWTHLGGRYQHLLVDECQDTSWQQIEILCELIKAWQGGTGHSLMIVGDPKQSIYGWRQARVELFLRTRQEERLPCPAAPALEILTLQTNFRSTGALVAWVNRVFGETVMSGSEGGVLPFHAALPGPQAESGSAPQLALFADQIAGRGRRREAEWLAANLRRRQDSLKPNETVGVLLFTRTHLRVYLEAWRRLGLNLKIKDGLPLSESRPVQHAHNLLTALVHPHDNVAWAALLRGFAGPQPLSLLAAIAGQSGEFWSEKIRAFVNSGYAPPTLRHFVQSLDNAAAKLGRSPCQEIISGLLAEIGAWEQAACWEGAQGVANLKAYLDLLAAEGPAIPAEILTRTTAILAQTYQPPDPQTQDAAIEVCTVHAAKGLEYDHVYVPFLDWQPLQTGRHDAPFLLEEMPGTGSAIIALNRPFQQEEQSVLYKILKRMGETNALGEARRLFYVAVTRAKKHLYLSGLVKIRANGEWDFPSQSPLGWLRQHYTEEDLIPGVEMTWANPPLLVRLSEASANSHNGTGSAGAMTGGSEWRGAGEGNSVKTVPLPPALEVFPESRPYELVFPSQLAAESAAAGEKEDEFSELEALILPLSRLRGDLTHRLMESLAQGFPLPEPETLALAVQKATADFAEALAIAREILTEVQACQADPFLAPLLARNLPVARNEWLLEAWQDLPESALREADHENPPAGSLLPPAPGNGAVRQAHDRLDGSIPRLYRGKIDRLVFDGQQWWLLDYKTSRPGPGVSWEEFEAKEVAKYRPQMLAYRAMAAKFYGLRDPTVIKTVIYFTAARRAALVS